MEMIKVMGRFLGSFINRLSTLNGYLSGWIIWGMAILETAAVVARRLLGSPLHFEDEYSAYMMVFCVFLGGAYTLLKDAHVRVDVIAIRLPEGLRVFLRALTSCFALLFCTALTWQSARLAAYYREIGHQSLSVLETPTWIPAIIIPIGAAILTLQMVVAIVMDVRVLLKK
jgi:TRAP-type C4-dicarboxylate transport system permease small subunit